MSAVMNFNKLKIVLKTVKNYSPFTLHSSLALLPGLPSKGDGGANISDGCKECLPPPLTLIILLQHLT